MLSYTLGRRIEITDRPKIDRIVSYLEEESDGFRDLVWQVFQAIGFQVLNRVTELETNVPLTAILLGLNVLGLNENHRCTPPFLEC